MVTNNEYPLVSAIMLIGKIDHNAVYAAINCFNNQTYPYKELIIINNATSQYKAASFDLKAEKDVFLIDLPAQLPTGAARNHGIAAANGQILAQFDADCYHAPNRLEVQIATLAKNESHICVLQETLGFSFLSGRAFYHKNDKRAILNTMTFVRPASIDYPLVEKGEEQGLVSRMSRANMTTIAIPAPELSCKFIFSKKHHSNQIVKHDLSKPHLDLLESILPRYQFPMPNRI